MTARRLVLLLFLLGPVGTLVAGAPHEGLHERIDAVSHLLRAEPGDPSLWVQRAELLRRHGNLAAARADLERALGLAPESRDAALVAVRVLRDEGCFPEALGRVQRVLDARPRDAGARLLRAELLASGGDVARAAGAYASALEVLEAPAPDHYLARARLEATLAAGAREPEPWLRAALRGLDEGLARLGPVSSLTLLAIELEQRRGAHDAALERLAPLLAGAARRERWLATRGEILAAAGRLEEAREALRAARRAIGALPAHRRRTTASRALLAEVDRRLAELPLSTPD